MRRILLVFALLTGFTSALFAASADLKCVCTCKDNTTHLNLASNETEGRSPASINMHFADGTSMESCHSKKDACQGYSLKGSDTTKLPGTLSCALVKPSLYKTNR